MQFSSAKFFADFYHAIAVHTESVIIERNLINTVFVMHQLHFIYDVFWRAHAVSSAKHTNSAAEVAPKDASAATDQGEYYFAVVL
jgi:hypothetical protein